MTDAAESQDIVVKRFRLAAHERARLTGQPAFLWEILGEKRYIMPSGQECTAADLELAARLLEKLAASPSKSKLASEALEMLAEVALEATTKPIEPTKPATPAKHETGRQIANLKTKTDEWVTDINMRKPSRQMPKSKLSKRFRTAADAEAIDRGIKGETIDMAKDSSAAGQEIKALTKRVATLETEVAALLKGAATKPAKTERAKKNLTDEQRKAIGVRLQTAKAAKMGLTYEQLKALKLRPGQKPTDEQMAAVTAVTAEKPVVKAKGKTRTKKVA